MSRGWDDQRIDDLICSMIEPGPSGVTISDNAFSRFETETKEMNVQSIDLVMNCGRAFILVSIFRRS